MAKNPDLNPCPPLFAFQNAAPKASGAIIHQGRNNCNRKQIIKMMKNNITINLIFKVSKLVRLILNYFFKSFHEALIFFDFSSLDFRNISSFSFPSDQVLIISS